MKKYLTTFALTFLLLTSSLFSSQTFAWGGRGHHTICEAACFLVKEKGLRDYLMSRPQMIGHLCNVPDFYWKTLGGEVNKVGNPTHYIDVEITGLKIEDVPNDYQEIVKNFQGKKNAAKEGATIFSIPVEFGSNWWRADQFYRRAVDAGKILEKASVPANAKEEQDENMPYNKAVYDYIVNIGLMGHFVGDDSQPFHSSLDYDGYGAGHGGIHAYYEDAGVSVQPYTLTSKIIEAAKKLQNQKLDFLTGATTIDKMKALSARSLQDIKAIYKIDAVKKPSTVVKEKGMEIRTAAERIPAETLAKKFEPLIVAEMARGAALLAKLWDETYVKVGKPKLTAYKSYKYPFTPEFIFPDYYETQKAETK